MAITRQRPQAYLMNVNPRGFNPYHFNFFLIRLSGFWQIFGKWRYMYIIYQTCVMSGYLLMLLSAMMIIIDKAQLTAVNEIMCVSCGIVINILKAALLAPQAAGVENLQAKFDQNLKVPPKNLGDYADLCFGKAFKHAKHLTIFTSVAMGMTATLWSLFPQLDGELGLPLPFWWPSDQIKLQYFKVVYGYQVCLLLSASLSLAGTDVMFCSFLLQVSTHYEILISNVSQMENRKLRIADFINHHRAIRRAVKQLEKIYKGAIVVQITIGTIIVCVSGFEVFVLNSEFNGHVPSRLLYMVLALFDIFIYCFYADKIIQLSERLAQALYNLPWHSFTWREQYGVMIMIALSRRPPTISVGSFAPLTLTTYLSVLQMAYSIFSLLSQVVTS